MKRPVSIKFSGTPSIDAGGPKRQFYTDALRALREGTANCLVPTSVLASGLFKVLGQVIVHSISWVSFFFSVCVQVHLW